MDFDAEKERLRHKGIQLTREWDERGNRELYVLFNEASGKSAYTLDEQSIEQAAEFVLDNPPSLFDRTP
jgi:hypothetical protein